MKYSHGIYPYPKRRYFEYYFPSPEWYDNGMKVVLNIVKTTLM